MQSPGRLFPLTPSNILAVKVGRERKRLFSFCGSPSRAGAWVAVGIREWLPVWDQERGWGRAWEPSRRPPHSGQRLSLSMPCLGTTALSRCLPVESGLEAWGLTCGRCSRGTCKGCEILDRVDLVYPGHPIPLRWQLGINLPKNVEGIVSEVLSKLQNPPHIAQKRSALPSFCDPPAEPDG